MTSLLLACLSGFEAGQGRVEQGVWIHDAVGLELPVPDEAATTGFSSGLDAVLLEAQVDDVELAVSAWPRPSGLLGERYAEAGALDLLRLAPALDAPMERLPSCAGAILQVGDEGSRLALAAPGGLVLIQAWGAPAQQRRAVLRQIACER